MCPGVWTDLFLDEFSEESLRLHRRNITTVIAPDENPSFYIKKEDRRDGAGHWEGSGTEIEKEIDLKRRTSLGCRFHLQFPRV